jgi:hypothetical protein
VGFSIWEAESDERLEEAFGLWRPYYQEVEIRKVISPFEAMKSLSVENKND